MAPWSEASSGATLPLGPRVPDVRRILVLRRRALGDILLTLPAVRALKETYPGASLDIVVDPEFREVVEGLSYIDEVLPFPSRTGTPRSRRGRALIALYREIRRRGYDLVIDALGTPRTAGLALWSGARERVGFAVRGRGWIYTRRVPRSDRNRPVYMRDAYLELAAAVGARTANLAFGPAGTEGLVADGVAHDPPRVALAPGASWSSKSWPIEHYGALARALLEDPGATVTVFWGPCEEGLADAIVGAAPGTRKAPPGTVSDLARAMAEQDLLISTDSGARHVASGVGTRTLGLFGPTDPRTATASEGEHVVLTHPIACAPCQRTTCPLAENYCLTRVLPTAVVETARRMLAEAGGAGERFEAGRAGERSAAAHAAHEAR